MTVRGWSPFTFPTVGPFGIAIYIWRSLKYECVYPHSFETWIRYYNGERPHSALDDQTPWRWTPPGCRHDQPQGLNALAFDIRAS